MVSSILFCFTRSHFPPLFGLNVMKKPESKQPPPQGLTSEKGVECLSLHFSLVNRRFSPLPFLPSPDTTVTTINAQESEGDSSQLFFPPSSLLL